MGVILHKSTAAFYTGQRAACLKAEVISDLGNTHRQIAIAVQCALIHDHMFRAVHRTQAEFLSIPFHDRKHIVLVMCQMSGNLIQLGINDNRSLYMYIALCQFLVHDVIRQNASNCKTVWQPHWKTGADRFRKHEDGQIFAKLAVISELCVFEVF